MIDAANTFAFRISDAIDRLRSDKTLRSITLFIDRKEKRKPKKIRITKQRKSKSNPTFLVTFGRLNHAEDKYSIRHWGVDNVGWPYEFLQRWPKKRTK